VPFRSTSLPDNEGLASRSNKLRVQRVCSLRFAAVLGRSYPAQHLPVSAGFAPPLSLVVSFTVHPRTMNSLTRLPAACCPHANEHKCGFLLAQQPLAPCRPFTPRCTPACQQRPRSAQVANAVDVSTSSIDEAEIEGLDRNYCDTFVRPPRLCLTACLIAVAPLLRHAPWRARHIVVAQHILVLRGQVCTTSPQVEQNVRALAKDLRRPKTWTKALFCGDCAYEVCSEGHPYGKTRAPGRVGSMGGGGMEGRAGAHL